MNGLDRFYKRQKEQDKDNKLPARGGMERYNQNRTYDASVVNDEYYQSFVEGANDLSTSFDNPLNDGARYKTWQKLNEKYNTLNTWLRKNKNNLSEDAYTSLSESIGAFSQFNDYFSQFESEDDYKKAVQAKRDYEALTTFDLEAGKVEIEGILNGDEITALKKERATLNDNVRKYNRGVRATYKTYDEVKVAKDRIAQLDKEISTIEEQADEKKQYWNRAKYTQDGLKLTNDALEAADFEEKSQHVIDTARSESGYDWTYEFIANMEANGGNKISAEEHKKNATLGNYGETTGYSYLTDEEIKIYKYYYAAEGKEKAEEYLLFLRETLNYRKALVEYKDLEGDTFAELGFGIKAGLDQARSGIVNLFNTSDNYIPASSTQMTSQLVREDLADDGFKIFGNSIGQIGYDLINTTSNMLPSILTSTAIGVINPAAGAAFGAGLMGASAAGNAYAEMLNLGYDKGQARMYSAFIGTSEATLQYLLGGIGKLGGKLSSKALTGVINNVDNAFARVSIKLGTKMASEFTEEYLQEVLTPVFKNMALGTKEDVNLFSTEALYSGILGALSAGILEGGSTIRSDIKTTKLGKSIQGVDGGVQRLKELGTTFSADTVAYQIADKVNEQTGAHKIGLLMQEVGGALSEQNVSDIVLELTKRGVTESDANKLAKTYQAFLNKEMSLTDEQITVLENCDPLTDVLRNNIIGKNTAVYQRTREYSDLVKLATEKTSATDVSDTSKAEESSQVAAPYSNEYFDSVVKEFENIGMSSEHARIMAEKKLSANNKGKTLPANENATKSIAESKFEVSAEGNTINTKSGAVVNVKNIESISDSGEANLTLDDGMVVKASDVSYGSQAEALFVENIGKIKVGKNRINTSSANALYQVAISALKANPDMTADEAMSLVKGLEESYVFGVYNFGRQELSARNEDGSPKRFSGELSQSQRAYAYDLGAKDRASEVEADQRKIDELEAETEVNKGTTAKTTTKKGKVRFENGVVAKGKLQKRTVALAKHLARAIGIDIVFYDARTTTNEDGKDANGYYDVDTDTIYLDLQNSWNDAKTIAFTLSHELVHFIKKWSPAKLDAFAKFLMKNYAEHDVDSSTLLSNKMTELHTNDSDYAYEEMICDACETMLLDSNVVYKLMELRKTDLELFDKIKLHIYKLLSLIRDMYKSLGLNPTSDEAKTLLEMKDVLEQIYVLFEEASVDAVQNYQAVRALETESATAFKTSIKKQAKTIRAGMSESERYSVLKDAKIIAIADLKSESQPIYTEIEKVPEKAKGQVEKLIRDLADNLDILNIPLSTAALNIEFQLSKNNGLRESLSQQLKYGGNFHDFSKALINLRDILNRAVLVEVHTEDRYKDTVREDINFEAGYVLFSAFKSQEYVIPVKLEIKQKKDAQNILYVVVSMTKIKRISVMESALTDTEVTSIPLSDTDSVYSLPHLVSKINPKDRGFLKYLPEQMLSAEQNAAKGLALKEDKEKLDKLPKKNNGVKKQLKRETNRSILANSLESATQNDIERNKLAQYKQKISLIEAAEQRLSEIRKQLFSKGGADSTKRKELQLEAKQIANRINIYDRQLLNLEATTALKNVLNREKEIARKRQKQKDVEHLKQYKERVANEQKEIVARYQESRKKAVEGRQKTAMRHKIQKVVSELNKLLLHGTKEKHVMIELQKAVAEALDTVNMDAVGAEERIKNLNEKIAKATDPDIIASLTESRDRIDTQGKKINERLNALKDAYNKIKNSEDPIIANSYDEVISSRLEYITEKIGNTALRDMSLEQLEDVYDMYKMVLTTVRNSNKAFKNAKNESIASISNRVMEEVEEVGGKNKLSLKGTEGIKKFAWNNLKPIYAFSRIGSGTLTEIFNDVRAGEDVWAQDVTEAKEYYREQSEKHNYDSWDFEKRYKFTSTSGMNFELSLEQIMSLYAYSKREQAAEHLRQGGIVFDETTEITVKNKLGIPLKFNPTEATAYNLSVETLADIVSKLTNEQRAFVDEMQSYLSNEMGEKGNEVSLEMYGVKLFKEKNYFPLKSATQFMAKAKEQQASQVKIKNSGFSKETVKKANNPIVLTPFMDVWSNHVNEMSMYHAFVLPMEDFYRVFNYKTPTSDDAATKSVQEFIQNAHGKGAVDYIDQLLKDLNGGAVSDPRETFSKTLMSRFKKAAVMASLSVVVQQPTAMVRAMALVDAKYFGIAPISRGVLRTVTPKEHKALWAEVKKYAPVAIIKEMGRFDTNMGRSVQDFVKAKEYKGFEKLKGFLADSEYRDDVLSKLPAIADEMAWVSIWEAIKRETVSKHKDIRPNSEEFLKIVGKRFTEVVTKTQVYDSVLARSGNMRSKTTFMNMWTSFMAEPTTSINMLEEALRQGKRGNKRYMAKTIGAVYGSVMLNAALVSIVYAMRDDDEDETFTEKYMSRLTTELFDGIIPITYIPFLKDVWSIAQGFDIERADMSLVADLVDKLRQTITVVAKDTEDMDEEELAEHQKEIAEALWGIADSISSLAGIPVKNVRRDINGVINLFDTLRTDAEGRKTTAGSLLDEIWEDVKSSIPGIGWLPKETKADKLYDAIISGDTECVNRLKSSYKDDKAYKSAVRKALRENDARIREAAQARIGGNIAEYSRLVKEIKAEGRFTQDAIVAAINAEINALNKGETSANTSNTESKETSIYKVDDYFAAINGGDKATASAVKDDLIQVDVANGKEREEAEADFNNKFTSYLREQYEEGNISKDEAQRMLVNYGGKSDEDAVSKTQYWEFRQKYPDYNDLSEEAVKKYYNEVETYGITINVYYDYSKKRSNCKGVDANGDGKTDSGSVKTEVLRVINSLSLTKAQKDALYRLNGWSEKNLYDAPWH